MYFFCEIILVLSLISAIVDTQTIEHTKEKFVAYPCEGNDKVILEYKYGRPPGEENKYRITVLDIFYASTKIGFQFDEEVSLVYGKTPKRKLFLNNDEEGTFWLDVQGVAPLVLPYLVSLKVNGTEQCAKPNDGNLEEIITITEIKNKNTKTNTTDTRTLTTSGQRRTHHTELISNDLDTQPGDWPWHAAIYRLELTTVKYICGGTLISKTFVVTAAHCVTVASKPVSPDILGVFLGKYNLIGRNQGSQERRVNRVIVHDNFTQANLNDDIALLKLKSEAVFNDFVLPAFIWSRDLDQRLNTSEVLGTVLGWGFDDANQTTNQLRHATIPKVAESTCIESNPTFYSTLLTNRKFCAGYRNGTSCYGDGGGGFVIFVPDVNKDNSSKALGSWYLRGILSLRLLKKKVCDPEQYVIFTDVAQYTDWLENHKD